MVNYCSVGCRGGVACDDDDRIPEKPHAGRHQKRCIPAYSPGRAYVRRIRHGKAENEMGGKSGAQALAGMDADVYFRGDLGKNYTGMVRRD